MRLFAASLLFALTPVLGLAQPALYNAAAASGVDAARSGNWLLQPETLAPEGNGSATTMPLWATSDGRILAMIAFGSSSHGAPTRPQSPQIGSAADWQLVDVTNFVTGGMSLHFGEHATGYAKFGRGIVLAPLNPAAASFGCSAAPKFAIDSPCGFAATRANRETLRFGTNLDAGNFDLDLGYGLSWLRYNDLSHGGQPRAQLPAWNLFAGLADEALPTLVVPGMEFANVLNSGVSAEGRWHLDETQSIDLGAALSRLRFDLPGNPLATSMNQAALSLGMQHGDFSGLIVGRVLGPADPLASGPRWTSVDLGISWRAPWRGVFSVGAQNLWSSGSPPLLSSPANAEADPSQARVPYVQYHQDL